MHNGSRAWRSERRAAATATGAVTGISTPSAAAAEVAPAAAPAADHSWLVVAANSTRTRHACGSVDARKTAFCAADATYCLRTARTAAAAVYDAHGSACGETTAAATVPASRIGQDAASSFRAPAAAPAGDHQRSGTQIYVRGTTAAATNSRASAASIEAAVKGDRKAA